MCGARVSRREWPGLIREARASGLPVEEWCEGKGVSIQAFRSWSTWFDGGGERSSLQTSGLGDSGTVIAQGVLPDGALIELEARSEVQPEASKAGATTDAESSEATGSLGVGRRARKKSPSASMARRQPDEETLDFVEIPMFDELCSETPETRGRSQEHTFIPRLMVRVGGYELFVGDGFEEQTLASALRVLADAV